MSGPREPSRSISPARVALLITDPYYPATFAGTHRPAKFAKYLPAFGWTPVVVCAEWTSLNSRGFHDAALGPEADVCETIRVRHVGFPRTVAQKLRLRGEQALFPFSAPLATMRGLIVQASDVVRRRRPCVVWSTALPTYPHAAAAWVSLVHGLPWVADFRDLPDQTYHGIGERRLVLGERVACARAAAFTVPSEMLARKLTARHRAPVHVVQNGFDDDDYPRGVATRTDKFVIAYFGILYAFRDPRPLFTALDALASRGALALDDVRVQFYGTPDVQVKPLLGGFACRSSVEILPRVGRAEMFHQASRAAVLLNLQGPEAGGAVPSKLTEYLGARRPILNIPGDDGPGDELLRATRAGTTVSTPDEIAGVLAAWYRAWKQTGDVRVLRDEDAVARFTRRRQAELLAGIFAQVAATGGSP